MESIDEILGESLSHENFMAMGAKVIDIMPTDPNNVQDVIKRAQKQGIKILVAGTDTTFYDVMMNMN